MVIQLEKGIAEILTSRICFFFDDLKLLFCAYNINASNMNSVKLLLDLVTQFSKNISMKLGESKCAYLQIERGRIKVNSENIKIKSKF